jgi:predicted adenine nucleotide alpha hydrolase (AANH) superfamily ATPase
LLPLENFEVNVTDMTAIKDFNPNEEYLLVKGEKNIRERGSQCAKYYDEMFDISSYQNIDGQE